VQAGDVSASLFSQDGVHRIAIFDIRLLNTDRNDENLLVKRTGTKLCELIPIDHGCSLPDTLIVHWYNWSWLGWPQSKLPLSQEHREYIAQLDSVQDAERLTSELGIRPQCLVVLRVATLFLQLGAAAKLTLFVIGNLMSRDEENKPSSMEVAFAQARARWMHKRAQARAGELRSPLVTLDGHSPPARKRSASCFTCPPVLDLNNNNNNSQRSPGLVNSGVDMEGCGEFDDLFWELLGESTSQAILHHQARQVLLVLRSNVTASQE
jgi:hypothetical protein